jgi:hypothetical protein
MVPWISITRDGDDPAFTWSPSMFWVISVSSLPRRSSVTKARWPLFGSACHAGESSRLCHARLRTSGSAT